MVQLVSGDVQRATLDAISEMDVIEQRAQSSLRTVLMEKGFWQLS